MDGGSTLQVPQEMQGDLLDDLKATVRHACCVRPGCVAWGPGERLRTSWRPPRPKLLLACRPRLQGMLEFAQDLGVLQDLGMGNEGRWTGEPQPLCMIRAGLAAHLSRCADPGPCARTGVCKNKPLP